MTNVERIYRFLDTAKSYMFVGGGLAFAAPYGFHFVVDGTLYFGREVFGYSHKVVKDTSKVELGAVGNGEYLRYSGDVKVIEDSNLIAKARKAFLERTEYCENRGIEIVYFSIENGHARFLDSNLELKEEFDV